MRRLRHLSSFVSLLLMGRVCAWHHNEETGIWGCGMFLLVAAVQAMFFMLMVGCGPVPSSGFGPTPNPGPNSNSDPNPIPSGHYPTCVFGLGGPNALYAPASLTWEPLGPDPMVDDFYAGGLVSGRVDALAIDPRNAKHWLVGAAVGGIWETQDAGQTWKSLLEKTDYSMFGVSAIAFAPTNSNVIYAGTGTRDAAGNGLLKSTDAGLTWTLLGKDDLQDVIITGIVIDPANPNTIEIGLEGAYVQGQYCRDLRMPGGLLRSDDGGKSWLTLAQNTSAKDLVKDPENFAHQVVFDSNGPRLLRTLDGGSTFEELDLPDVGTGDTNGKLALTHTSPQTLYVAYETDSGSVLRIDNIWDVGWKNRSHTLSAPNFCGSAQCFHALVLSTDPANENNVYVGGVILLKYLVDSDQWVDVGLTGPGDEGEDLMKEPSQSHQVVAGLAIHTDQKVLAWAGNRLIVGNDGGIWSSVVPGSDPWLNHNSGLATTMFWDGDLSARGGIIGGTQDNGTVIGTLGSMSWAHILGGDGFSCSISNDHPDWLMASIQFLTVARSFDLGKSWETVKNYVPSWIVDESFNTNLTKCPFDDNLVLMATRNGGGYINKEFFGSCGIISCPKFRPLGSGIPGEGFAFLANHKDCSTFVAWGDTAHTSNIITITHDAGQTWFVTHSPLPINDLVFDPNSSEDKPLLYSAGLGQIGRLEILVPPEKACPSTTCGVSVNSYYIDLGVRTEINSLAFDPRRDMLFAGTQVGVFMLAQVSQCFGSSTCRFLQFGPHQGISNVPVKRLRLVGNNLVAFTFGRGAYKLDLRHLSL